MPTRKVNLGHTCVNVGDDEVHRAFWDLVDAGRWEPGNIEAIERLAEGGIFIDVGAWIGPTVLAGARTATTVIAYEPDPIAADELRSNLNLNGVTNVEVREIALFDRDGIVPFGPGMHTELGLSYSSLVYGPTSLTVQSRDARKEATSAVFAEASLLKIDIEGGEYRLVRRLGPYLLQHHPTLLLSLHGVRWNRRKFVPGPRWVNVGCRRMANAVERAPLLWRLRHYRHCYLRVRGQWQPLTRMSRWKLVGYLAEQELLLSNEAYRQ